MSFVNIAILVLAAAFLLALLFVFFHIFVALLPIMIIAAIIIWLIYWFTGRKNKNNIPSSGNEFEQFRYNSGSRPHKKARNVTTKDVDDDK